MMDGAPRNDDAMDEAMDDDAADAPSGPRMALGNRRLLTARLAILEAALRAPAVELRRSSDLRKIEEEIFRELDILSPIA